jgi:hypothetical protein
MAINMTPQKYPPPICLVHLYTVSVNIPIEATSDKEAEEKANGIVQPHGGYCTDVMQGEW